MHLTDCHNIDDFRALAKRRLPWPVFDYIDGAADDEITRRRNRAAFDDCDLIPRVLAGVETVDMKTTLFGREMAMPLFLSPTALQRLFHWQGERAVLRAAANAGTMAGISSLATISLAEAGALSDGPKLFQLYVHKDEGLNRAMLAAARKCANPLLRGGFCGAGAVISGGHLRRGSFRNRRSGPAQDRGFPWRCPSSPERWRTGCHG